MEIVTANTTGDSIEAIVDMAYQICDKLLLFEASSMKENEIRFFLECNKITERETQDKYINLVRNYDRETGGYSS
jgi:hypothetical protein